MIFLVGILTPQNVDKIYSQLPSLTFGPEQNRLFSEESVGSDVPVLNDEYSPKRFSAE